MIKHAYSFAICDDYSLPPWTTTLSTRYDLRVREFGTVKSRSISPSSRSLVETEERQAAALRFLTMWPATSFIFPFSVVSSRHPDHQPSNVMFHPRSKSSTSMKGELSRLSSSTVHRRGSRFHAIQRISTNVHKHTHNVCSWYNSRLEKRCDSIDIGVAWIRSHLNELFEDC